MHTAGQVSNSGMIFILSSGIYDTFLTLGQDMVPCSQGDIAMEDIQ